jgi:hypothetical protein
MHISHVSPLIAVAHQTTKRTFVKFIFGPSTINLHCIIYSNTIHRRQNGSRCDWCEEAEEEVVQVGLPVIPSFRDIELTCLISQGQRHVSLIPLHNAHSVDDSTHIRHELKRITTSITAYN